MKARPLDDLYHPSYYYGVLHFSSLHIQAGKSEDLHPKPFQSKHSIKAIRDLPSSTVSREHLGGASDSSLQTVRPSLNSFVKIEW